MSACLKNVNLLTHFFCIFFEFPWIRTASLGCPRGYQMAGSRHRARSGSDEREVWRVARNPLRSPRSRDPRSRDPRSRSPRYRSPRSRSPRSRSPRSRSRGMDLGMDLLKTQTRYVFCFTWPLSKFYIRYNNWRAR